ncbi:aminodeoxychorismate lyase [Bacillus sp. V3-13]|uniref:endolytic transglycosylase MltG n=1 Tax=Bacillus sp. V3-13 TaxID=2053728 RepID=UPI000C78A581|nr:endolytic transglycosylase MltG [Bacillus sp. V3-13]PLR76961.1 aminodeoxychorismate lyase [Bacillus sp. V3-13]
MNKRSVRSFAVGILFTVSCIGSYYFFIDGKPAQSVDQSIEKLEAEGYVVLSQDHFLELKRAGKAQTEANPPDTTEKKEEQAANSEQPEQNPEQSAPAYQLVVTSGMTSSEIATLLAEQTIIENPREFELFMERSGYSTKIQVGTFEINKGMDYEEIGRLITKN